MIYHGKEDAKLWVHPYNVSISEYEFLTVFFLAQQKARNLLRSN